MDIGDKMEQVENPALMDDAGREGGHGHGLTFPPPRGQVIQTNFNHAIAAHDPMVQGHSSGMVDTRPGLGTPGRLLGDRPVGPVADPAIALVACGHGFVAVDLADCLVVGVYPPPRWPISRFDTLLDELQSLVSLHAARPVFVLGEFNSHASAWAKVSWIYL
ncbi:uncharacterized protein LOC143433139 [Xylocopa sonorina]|uniref:uncharacterized protein LOC143433139 n=1 Tax=Xylocopa sonorina TaxID=1818115 RepID=UPI00403AE0E7